MTEGIPTIYKKIRFRSRLEAKWAVFFDLLEWKWEYEPFDLDGWIPDFILLHHKQPFVEIKPFTLPEKFDLARKKVPIEYSVERTLFCGCTIWGKKDNPEWPCIGWFSDRVEGFGEASLNFYKNRYGFFHSTGSFEDRITGLYDGDHFLKQPDFKKVKELWAEAGNKVQWKRTKNG